MTIERSLLFEQGDPEAVERTIHKLKFAGEWLQMFIGQGKKLSTLIPVNNELRYVLYGDYCIIYYQRPGNTVIIRIFPKQNEFMQILLRDKPESREKS